MKLSKQEIQHIADLARLDLSEEEQELYSGQLSDILDYVNQLQEVDTTGVKPTAQVTGLENIMREDKAKDWDAGERRESINQAPDREKGQVKVKRIL
ncbi:MAG: Asp-tRNA(Asn)/Glu-tRNA(Gln) amidotransferase subunit GatC [Patescibacteria group bacterium]|nr:Asp-tRNA(Asn)/Glu-tRNA(Gln) amidotransferase subunit GatC [Patescibacteria group bacterium]